MEKDNTGLIIVGILILVALFLIPNLNLGNFAILPEGEYNSNDNCTFITNVGQFANGDYDWGRYSSWISVDSDKDGILEGYGTSGVVGSSGDACRNKEIITYTMDDKRVVKYRTGTRGGRGYLDIGICSEDGQDVKLYRDIDEDATTAILTCDNSNLTCVSNWQCSSWSQCSNNQQTRTCTDLNGCGLTTNKPSEVQSCDTTPECSIGDTKCDGNNYYTCLNSDWVNQGQVNGQCGYTSGGVSTSCDFVTNIDPETSRSPGYSPSDTWISIDTNGNGDLEKFGKYSSGVTTSPSWTDILLVENYNSYGDDIWLSFGGILYVKSSTSYTSFRQNYGAASEAVDVCPGDTTPECSIGDTKCEGTTFYSCASGEWVVAQTFAPACGYSQQCNTGADTDCNGEVDRDELGSHISKWIQGQVSRSELGSVLEAWILG